MFRTEMSQDVLLIENISRDCFRSFSGLPNGSLIDTADVYGAINDVPLTFFNGIATTHIAGDVHEGIARVMQPFRERRRGFRWWITPATQPANLPAALLAHGFRHVYDAPGMCADLARLPAMARSGGLTIERVRDVKAFEPWVRILGTVFHLPPEDWAAWLEAFREIGFAEDAPWVHFVGSLDGTPVATTSLLRTGGEVAGVYHVATLAEARGRGIGAAVTHAAMLHARDDGARKAVLQSSELGFNVYRSLGFEARCDLTLYDWRG
jgi:ribosomal protein S18 acetylase RimI-like enzyme